MTDATPASRRLRTGSRGIVLAPALAIIGCAVVAAGLAAGAVLRRTGTTEPGAVVGPRLIALVLGLLLVPLPGGLQPYDTSATWTDATVLWTVLGAGCVVATLVATADRGHGTPGDRARRDPLRGPTGHAASE